MVASAAMAKNFAPGESKRVIRLIRGDVSGKVRKQWHDFQKKQSVPGSRGGPRLLHGNKLICVYSRSKRFTARKIRQHNYENFGSVP
jgi:hypothetical protein